MSVTVMSLVWKAALPPPQKFVLLAYADRSDDEGKNIYPSIPTIARKTGYSERNVQYILKSLLSSKVMVKVGINTTYGNVYQYEIDLDLLEKLGTGGAKFAPVQNTTKNMSQIAPYTSFNTSSNSTELPKNGNSVAPAPDPKPKKQRDPLLDHPAIVAYRDVIHLSIPEVLRQEVVDIVGERDEMWRAILRDWLAIGWNPRNIKGMLECFFKGGIPVSKNGNINSAPSGLSQGTLDTIARLKARRAGSNGSG